MEKTTSRRRVGREMRAVAWAARHPGWVLVPGVPVAASVQWGMDAVAHAGAGAVGGALVAGGVWYRAHPDTFDRWMLPVLRSTRRRWWTYVGWRWRAVMEDCDLVTTHRRTQEARVPRVLSVRSWSPTTDVVRVRMAPGQSLSTWQQQAEVLAESLRAVRVGVEKIKPRVVSLIVERSMPFTEVITAPEMPQSCDAVDLDSVFVGEDEYGRDFRISPLRHHVFIAGRSGSGKNSIPASMFRALAPLIRDGLVRLWLADPKQTEFAALRPIAHRYSDITEPARDDDDGPGDGYTIGDLVREFRGEMERRQKMLGRKGGARKLSVSRDTPLDLLVLDELGAITAYSDLARAVRRDLAVIGTQGRATLNRMWGIVQEPSKDVVPIRDLFTQRVCLGVTSAAHVDMALGEDARARGALADEIPDVPESAGIGFVIRPRTRVPLRVRAAYVDDTDLAELVAFVLSGQGTSTDSHLKVVA